MSEKIKLKYFAFLNQSGYSAAAQNYVMALDKSQKYDIKLKVFGGKPAKPAISDDKYSYFMKMVNKEDQKDSISVYHCIPVMQRRIKDLSRSVGFATFETFNPPDNWVQILNKNDAIIVPSQFNYKIFSHLQINKPIYHIPHCIDINLYNDQVYPMINYDKFTFLFMGAWKERKGYKQLIEAWFREFSELDRVQLLIKTDLPKKAEQYIINYKKEHRIKQGFAPIIIENKVFDEKTLPHFMKSANCLIAPTCGEGFFVPGLQCMAMKIPVIVTNFSGCKDYANEKTSVLLEPSGFILKNDMDGIPQFRGKKWAFITVASIRNAMRYVLENRVNMEEKTSFAYDFVRQNFNYNRISELFNDMVKELYG